MMKKRIEKKDFNSKRLDKKWNKIVWIYQAIDTLLLGIILIGLSDFTHKFMLAGSILSIAAVLEIAIILAFFK